MIYPFLRFDNIGCVQATLSKNLQLVQNLPCYQKHTQDTLFWNSFLVCNIDLGIEFQKLP